jgi:NHL repeat-containing protein
MGWATEEREEMPQTRSTTASLLTPRRESSQRRLRLSLVLLAAFLSLLAVSAGVAQAEAPRLISYGHIGSGKVLEPLADPDGIAVDNSTSPSDPSAGDLYIAGAELFYPPNIMKLDASGKLLAPSPFGEDPFGLYTGTAVNPTNGDAYILESFFNEEGTAFEQAIATYDPSTGVRSSSFLVPGSPSFGNEGLMPVQIAADSAGNVYVPITPLNEVLEYSPAGGTPLHTFTGSGASALNNPTGVAIDASGNVWVADAGNNRIEELSASDTFVAEIKSEGVQTLALDPSGDVFALVENSADSCGSLAPPCDHLLEYSSSGAQRADVGAGLIAPFERLGFGLHNAPAVDDATGHVYVTDGGHNIVWNFGPPIPPKLDSELAVQVTSSGATLGARIEPGGIDASYRFEYDTREYRDGEAPHGQSVPFPEGDGGAGLQPTTVWAGAFGLQPSTTYHYRVVVTNELGAVAGADQTFTTAAEAGCPNELLRTGFSANLPDCRAYEVVTPPTRNRRDEGDGGNFAASDGNRFAYVSQAVLPGSQTAGLQYLATRGPGGWSSENEIPPQAGYYGSFCEGNAEISALSADLSKAVLVDGRDQVSGESTSGGDGGCGGPEPELVSGEPKEVENLFVRDAVNHTYQLIDVTPPGITPENAVFRGASTDLSHVVFVDGARLTADAPHNAGNLYEWSGGVVRLVTVLPDGTPIVGSLAAGKHAVSSDGSHVFFTAGGKLYVRLNGEHTAQVDESRGGSGPGGGGSFQAASADGSQVFFTDDASAGLTSDTVPGSGANLYRYEVPSGQLTDLTPAGAAEVEGVSSISEDGSYVYFAADGALSGTQANGHGATAQSGQPNLYLWHGGTITFIATLSHTDACRNSKCRQMSSEDGLFFAFSTHVSVTGYDNIEAGVGAVPEIFLYSVASNQLACVSCNPSGEAPVSTATLVDSEIAHMDGGAEMEEQGDESPRYLTDGGRVIFETADALLPAATNGQVNVYEYEQGQLYLISTGTSSQESEFIEASPNGEDIFLRTYQQLVPQATKEEVRVIYDARVNGGFPPPAAPPPCTTADACRPASSPQPAIFGAPASSTFSGAGNLAPSAATPRLKPRSKPVKCRKGFVRRKVKGKTKCVRNPARKASKSVHAKKRGH